MPAGAAAAEVVEVLEVPIEGPAPPTTDGNEFVYTTEADDDDHLCDGPGSAAPFRLLLASCRRRLGLLLLLLDDGGACCRTSRLMARRRQHVCFAVP